MVPYIINSFRGGVSDESDKGISGSFKHGYSLDIHKRDDSLTCKQAMVQVDGGTVDTLINFFVPASDGTTYAFGATGSVYARSGDQGDGAWNFCYNDENGGIKGAAEWKLSDGNNYIMWATATSLARVLINGAKDLPWSTGATQDYKTTLDPADWHTMEVGAGQLNIANNNFLATLDYDENFDVAAMNIRPGNLIKTLEERDDYIILGSTRKDEAEEGHIWSWVTTAINWVQKKKIPIKGVNALIQTELTLLQGGDDGEIFQSDFVNVTPIHAVPGGGKVNPGGVTIDNDIAALGFYGGTYPGIWTFGRRLANRPHALNYGYRLSGTVNGSTVSTIGAIAMVGGELLASWGTTDGSTTEYGVDSSSSTTKADALYETLEFDGGAPQIKKIFNSVKLTMSPMPASTTVAVSYKLDKGSWAAAQLGDGSTTFSETNATEAEFILGVSARIIELRVQLFAAVNETPEILNVILYMNEGGTQHA